MEIVTVFLLLLVPLILLRILKPRAAPETPPGPAALPLIGNLHQIGDYPHMKFWEMSKKYGPLVYLKIGSRPVVVANSAAMAEVILKHQDLVFCSRTPFLAFMKLSYGGLDLAFSPYDEGWREMRKVCMTHLLSAVRVRSFRHIRQGEVSAMVERISGHATKSEKANLTEIITFMTSTVISRTAFGKRYEQDSGERRQFNEIIREFQTAIAGFHFVDYFPWLAWVDRITGRLHKLDEIFNKWDAFYQQLIDEHRREDRPSSMNGDVVDIMLKLKDENATPFELTIDRIKGVLVDVYFASTDTIATTLVWAMTALLKNPAVMKKAQLELRSIGAKQMISEEDLIATELPYLRSIIRETLRMYPTIPLLVPRETISRTTINGYEIPAKTTVHVNSWGIGRDEEIWENPNQFCPERFMENLKKYSLDLSGKNFEFIPFGGGRRGCPGATMAVAMVELALANLIYHFDWELPVDADRENLDCDITMGLSFHKTNPLICFPSHNSAAT